MHVQIQNWITVRSVIWSRHGFICLFFRKYWAHTPCRSHIRNPRMSRVTLSALTTFAPKAFSTAFYSNASTLTQFGNTSPHLWLPNPHPKLIVATRNSPTVQDSITSSINQTNPATVNRSLQVWDMCCQTFVAKDSGMRRVKADKSVRRQFHRKSKRFFLSVQKKRRFKSETVSPAQYRSIWSATKIPKHVSRDYPACYPLRKTIHLLQPFLTTATKQPLCHTLTCRWNRLKQSRSSWHKAFWRSHRL